MGEFENIEIKRIFDIVKSKKLLIAFIVILFTLLGYVYSYYYVTPEYKSTTTLLLTSEEDNVTTTSDLNLNSGLISTYSNIAKGSGVLKQVINNLNLEMTEKQLQNKVTVNVIKNTYVIEIAVKDKNPQQAMEIAKELANVFLSEIKQIYSLENIGIVDEAQLPIQPYNINHIKDIFIFFSVGIFISLASMIVIYIFDNTLKNEEDVEKYLKIKALGTVPINENKNEEIVNKNNAKSYITEHLNAIRTNILYMNSTKNDKTILITSCTPQEGKSWISANIAVSFAETDKKVLLIDADMRKGRANKIFDVDNKVGLSNYLYSMTREIKSDIELARQYISETKIPNLHILTNGSIPPNPSELLNSANMKELVNIFKNIYDIIIIDAPPCKLVTDSIILSTIVDSTVLVANSEKTKINDLNEVKKSIQIVGGEIIGAILNKVKLTEKTYSKGYYYVHSKDTYEVKEKEIISVNEIIDSALIRLEKNDFNITDEENITSEIQEEQPTTEVSNIDKIIKKQNQYLKKVSDAMADMKVQLNSNSLQNELKNKTNKNKFEKSINKKLDELQQKNSEELKEIQEKNNNDLKELQERNSNELKELYEKNFSEIRASQEKNISELKANIVTKEQIKEMLSEEIIQNKINIEQIQEIFEDINKNNITKDEFQEILSKEINKDSITREELEEILSKEFNKDIVTKEQIKEIFSEEINKNNITKEQIEEILSSQISNDNIEKIIEIIKDEKQHSITPEEIKEIMIEENDRNNLHIEQIKQIFQEEISRNTTRIEQIRGILQEEINNITYSNQIDKLYNEIADIKSNYKQMQNTLRQEISSINYTQQIDKINEMMINLKDSYLELSNMIRTSNINEFEEVDNTNVINIKTLKQQKEKTQKLGEYSLDEDIPYEDLEKTAMYIIPLNQNAESDFEDSRYEENMM